MSEHSASSPNVEGKPSLLNLPRELRNLIIDEVLCFLGPPPIPTRHDPGIYPRGIQVPVSVPTTRTVHHPLSHTNAQLRAETFDRASKIYVPLVLDILVLEDGHTQCTWLSAPVTPRELHKVNMEIGIRLRPIDLDKVQIAAGKEFVHRTSPEIALARDWARHQLEYKILNSIRTALLAILFDDGLSPTKRIAKATESGTPDTYFPVNSITKLNVTVTKARDAYGRTLSVPDGEMTLFWYQPNIFPPSFTNELAKNLKGSLLSFGPDWAPRCAGQFELFYRPILTNVRVIAIKCDEDPTGGHIYDVGFEMKHGYGRGRTNVQRELASILQKREQIWPKGSEINIPPRPNAGEFNISH